MMLNALEFGNPNAERVIVMMAGFPDDQTSGWGVFLDKLKATENVYILCLCFPGLEIGAKSKPWGYTFPEIRESMLETINHYVGPTRKVDLIIHDWGSYLGTAFENKYPDRVNRIVNFDVGILKAFGLKQLVLILYYHMWFMFSYIIAQALNWNLGNFCFFMFFALTPKFLQPCPHEKPLRNPKTVNVDLCYIYFQYWFSLIANRKNFVDLKMPKCPILFMYGKKKNILFHDSKYVKKIESTPGSKVIGIDEVGHWIAPHMPDFALAETKAFLQI